MRNPMNESTVQFSSLFQSNISYYPFGLWRLLRILTEAIDYNSSAEKKIPGTITIDQSRVRTEIALIDRQFDFTENRKGI